MTLSDYLALIPGASQEKARFMAITSAILQQAVDLQNVVLGLNAAQSVDYAVGVQLDAIASSVGLSREDVTNSAWDLSDDELFRIYLKRKMIQWTWDGTMKDAERVMALVKPNPGDYAGQIVDAGASLWKAQLFYYNSTYDVAQGLATGKEGLPVPAGVKIEVIS